MEDDKKKKCCENCEDCDCNDSACCNGTCSCCKQEPLTREMLEKKKEHLQKKMEWVDEQLKNME